MCPDLNRKATNMTAIFSEIIEVNDYLDGDTDTAKVKITATTVYSNGSTATNSSAVVRKSNIPALIAALTAAQN